MHECEDGGTGVRGRNREREVLVGNASRLVGLTVLRVPRACVEHLTENGSRAVTGLAATLVQSDSDANFL